MGYNVSIVATLCCGIPPCRFTRTACCSLACRTSVQIDKRQAITKLMLQDQLNATFFQSDPLLRILCITECCRPTETREHFL